MRVAWTGHRPDLFHDPIAARAAVESAAGTLVAEGATRFVVGGQRGVDTWAAVAALAHGIPFSLFLPFEVETFAAEWVPADRSVLEQTMSSAAEVRIAGDYTRRNRLLVENADLLVVVWSRTRGGGTAETLGLAQAAGIPMREIVLAPSGAAGAAHGRGI